MCPGLTSPGVRLPAEGEGYDSGMVVTVNAEGKENACMVGILKMSTDNIRKENKVGGVETVHYLGDGLWKLDVDKGAIDNPKRSSANGGMGDGSLFLNAL